MHSCLSVYRGIAQKRPSHLQENPVKPNFFLQTAQRFFFFFDSLGSFSSSFSAETAQAPSVVDTSSAITSLITSGTATSTSSSVLVVSTSSEATFAGASSNDS